MSHPSFNPEQLKIVIVGHVDHGKSTFVGRLLHDTGSLPEGKFEQLEAIAARRGVPFEWANLMDALQAERDQNITIDTAQIWFRSKKRQYIIIDAPGHKEFLKNMITGAANAEAALLLIDAHEGVQEQSRRHGYLLNLLGIRQIAVLVNKMDLQNYSESRFKKIEEEFRAFLKSAGVTPMVFIPMAAKHGDNIAVRSPKMPWWTGQTVVEALDEFKLSDPPTQQPLRFPIQDVYRFDERRILAGRIESGILKVGDRLLFTPGNKISTVKTIERWSAPPSDRALAGESIGVTLTEQIFVRRGEIAALETDAPYELSKFKARLFWLGRAPFTPGRLYKLKLATQEVECEIASIEKIIDSSSLEPIARPASFVGRNEVAELTLRTKRPVAFDVHADIIATGRFVIVDGLEVAGGGIIAEDNYPKRTADSLQKSHNIYWSQGKITAEQRAQRNGHGGRVLWLTGLSASGKSTIANELERELFSQGRHVYVLDGDNMRHGLCSDLGFSPRDRKENIRRIGETAKLFAEAGIICITAFISPYRSDRDMVRKILDPGVFVEVYVNAPLEVCESRDPKGLYVKARANRIKDFTGISAPYEPPEKAEIELPTDQLSVEESVARIIDYLKKPARVIMGFEETKAELLAAPRGWLVTGVAGFIGSNLLEALLRLNQRVIGLDNLSTGAAGNLNQVQAAVGARFWKNFKWIEGDIRDPATCLNAIEGVDYVLHQAGLGSVPRSLARAETNAVNVTGFLNMLEAAREHGVLRFVFASSSSVYGDAASLPQVEDTVGNCLSPYAVSKRVNELYAGVFAQCYGMQTIGLRYFNVFGPRQDPNGPYAAVIPKWIAAMLNDEPVYINGDGTTSRDFCYVANVIQANILAATVAGTSAVNTVYNIALGDETTLGGLFQMLRDRLVAGHPRVRDLRPIHRPFQAGDVRHSRADIARARRLLGYAPTHGIENGIDETVSWYMAMANNQRVTRTAPQQAPVA